MTLASLPAACGRPRIPSVRAEAASSTAIAGRAPVARYADDLGRFLAGLPGAEGSPFAKLELTDEWKTHRSDLDAQWSKIQSATLPAMSRFQNAELDGGGIGRGVVFYPFSGPDTLFVTLFFPHSPTYVMVGLEPPGTLPAEQAISGKELGSHLQDVRETVFSELHRSFFITRQMDKQFRGQVSDGLLPAMLMLLARSGYTVVGYRYIRLDSEGKIAGRKVDGTEKERTPGRNGVQIDFRTPSDPASRSVFYFSVNLADERLGKNEAFLKFLSRLRGMTTYMKATSYMPRHKEFAIFEKKVLDESDAILQDDSGIPYADFAGGPWNIQLYGSYDKPYGSFQWAGQPDLKKAYTTLHPKELDFHIGYGFARIPSNLLLATRQAAMQTR